MFKKGKRGITIFVIIALVVAVGYVFRAKIKDALLNRIVTDNETEIELYVNKEHGLEGLKMQLLNEKVINTAFSFNRMVDVKGFSSDKIATGKYIIKPKTPIRDLINGFTENAQGNGNAEVEVQVTFNNCSTIGDMCKKVSKAIMCDSTELENFIFSQETMTKYGFTKEQLPALFIPNTYNFFWDTNPEQFVERMATEFRTFWTDARKLKMKQQGFSSPSQVVTLASIVYGEQSIATNEWATIARLYMNRIKVGMKLQSDPTFKFCWGDKLNSENILTYEHRAVDCPYNTYIYAGLPPGPISLPPAGVVDAVLSSTTNDYLYMCAKPDYTFTHNFTRDYAVHQKNAAVYQKWIREEQKKKK